MFPFGSIVLTRFPFTDLSGDKRRPALVVSRDNHRRRDLVTCFTTSRPGAGPEMAFLDPEPETGLKVLSAVRFDKIATLERNVIVGKFGEAPSAWLSIRRPTPDDGIAAMERARLGDAPDPAGDLDTRAGRHLEFQLRCAV